MIKISIGMTINEKIDLYFFSPRKSSDEYREYYKKVNPERYGKEKAVRFSPLYLLLRDLRHCLALGKGYDQLRKDGKQALFTSIILINIGFAETVKRIYVIKGKSLDERMNLFAGKYMEIKEARLLKALRELRNSIEHSNYGLSTYVNEEIKKGQREIVKYYFYLAPGIAFKEKFIIKENINWKRTYKSRMFFVNPSNLYTTFVNGLNRLEQVLRNKKEVDLRDNFQRNLSLDNWIIM